MAKKKCFIITPIGSETDAIRRHIDGIIDAAIEPALKDQFIVHVSHRIYEPGSLTKQIITEIYKADLVIANLTDRNPNVMYELALRYCLGTPIINIAEQGTKLPADIISERTIFYQNDAKGVLELQDKLSKCILEIDYTKKSSPILDVIKDVINTEKLLEITEGGSKDNLVMNQILRKLRDIENNMDSSANRYQNERFFSKRNISFTVDYKSDKDSKSKTKSSDFFIALYNYINETQDFFELDSLSQPSFNDSIDIDLSYQQFDSRKKPDIVSIIKDFFEQKNITILKIYETPNIV